MILHSLKSRLVAYPLCGFFILSFAISWLLWVPLLVGHSWYGWTSWEGNSWTNGRTHLAMLGSLGPALAALVMTAVLEGRQAVRALLRRMLLWRVGIVWWLVAFYAWWLIASVLAVVLQLAPAGRVAPQAVFSLLNIPVLIFVLQMPLLLGIVGEELGWRGFALPRLIEKRGPVVASLILALPWMLWHAPLTVFGDWSGGLPVPLLVLRYAALVLPLTLVMTWFFQRTAGSVLLIIVLHRAFNLTFNAFSGVNGLSAENGRLLFYGVIAVLWAFAAFLVVRYRRASQGHAGDPSERHRVAGGGSAEE